MISFEAQANAFNQLTTRVRIDCASEFRNQNNEHRYHYILAQVDTGTSLTVVSDRIDWSFLLPKSDDSPTESKIITADENWRPAVQYPARITFANNTHIDHFVIKAMEMLHLGPNEQIANDPNIRCLIGSDLLSLGYYDFNPDTQLFKFQQTIPYQPTNVR